ncbi:DUF4440 domain-containing protein [Caenorhabditis elegans]|uniref:DUF4440 domain-containing protein n=1 Tax=Caenorhabditis elegans TaxID=6239 RepID=G4RVA5_CAEEL|nr:DUF4440 domain-containing protein [Caenorhabditis elegans]CCD62901.1 DUF4440 domain-containing protein [Caenorhabditis elegans]|eukprot:NP_504533.3 Uncharacterized protein CELE_C04E6.8 [Caenorhabditis elegans]
MIRMVSNAQLTCEDPTELKKILAPYFAGFNQTTEVADAEGSMRFMHPQGVIVQKDKDSTFGKKALTDLFKRWYDFTGPYYFNRYDEKYSGGGDWIVVEAKMELVKVEGKEVILRGEVMHIWKKENDEWLMFYEQYHVDN